MNTIELFGGVGGLALGLHEAGFHVKNFVDRDPAAIETVRHNLDAGCSAFRGCELHQVDASNLEFEGLAPVDVVSAGVPCQPFSFMGKRRGHIDDRNLFPLALRAVRQLSPKAVIIENVRGLSMPKFRDYFDYLQMELAAPSLIRGAGESWPEHAQRLQEALVARDEPENRYHVYWHILNAADYGVPQMRERIFIVAFRRDLQVRWSPPEPTHSMSSLFSSQWRGDGYWLTHGMKRPHLTKSWGMMVPKIKAFRDDLPAEPKEKPWVTVRDAFDGVLKPPRQPVPGGDVNHVYRPGARRYHGHLGSHPDLPSKTIKAGNHGQGGGENTLQLPQGRVRYFTVREMARLQSFPDDYAFRGTWTQMTRQLGNAVPVRLAAAVARRVRQALNNEISSAEKSASTPDAAAATR